MVKTLTVRVFAPGNKSSRTNKLFAGPRKAFTPVGVDEILEKMADDLEKHFPGHEYRLVPLGPGTYNLVWEKGPHGF